MAARRVQEDAAGFEKEHAVAALERQRRPLLGDDDGAVQLDGEIEERLGSLGIELGRRLVEQQERGVEREDGREADAL